RRSCGWRGGTASRRWVHAAYCFAADRRHYVQDERACARRAAVARTARYSRPVCIRLRREKDAAERTPRLDSTAEAFHARRAGGSRAPKTGIERAALTTETGGG